MKSLQSLLIAIGLFYGILFANDHPERPILPLEVSLPYLQSIQNEALVLGEGATDVYVFIDPHCPNSQNFISLVYENEKMRSRYHYYFFLYELERFHSHDLIAKIYSSSDPIQTLLDVMARNKKYDGPIQSAALEKIKKIAAVADKIDVYKRPYIIMIKKPKTSEVKK